MSGLSDFLKNRLLNHVFRGEVYAPPAVIYAAAFESESTECGFAGYARVPVSFDEAVAGATGSDVVARFPAKTDMGLVMITHGALFDASQNGNALTDVTALAQPIPVGMNDLFEFPVGDILVEWVR